MLIQRGAYASGLRLTKIEQNLFANHDIEQPAQIERDEVAADK